MKTNAEVEIINYGIDRLKDLEPDSIEGAELHNYMYNEDYFIIGTWNAEKFLENFGVFNAIARVQEWEDDNIGERSVDISDAEKLANMLAYVVGYDALNECPTVHKAWDENITTDNIQNVIKELENL